jgi:hypothetical protein
MKTFPNGGRIDFLGMNPIEEPLARSWIALTKLAEKRTSLAILNE